MSAVTEWNQYAEEVMQRSSNARSRWEWKFDPVSMELSFAGLVVAVLLCDKQSQQTAEADIDADSFIEAQQDLGHKLVAVLNSNRVRHPLALATIELKGAKQ